MYSKRPRNKICRIGKLEKVPQESDASRFNIWVVDATALLVGSEVGLRIA